MLWFKLITLTASELPEFTSLAVTLLNFSFIAPFASVLRIAFAATVSSCPVVFNQCVFPSASCTATASWPVVFWAGALKSPSNAKTLPPMLISGLDVFSFI